MTLYKKKKFFTNKKFNINLVKFCKAIVGISKDRVRFMIFNKNEKAIEMFADYQIIAENVEEYTTGLINLFESYKVFDYFSNQTLKIIVETNKFSLVPLELFHERDTESYLKFSCELEKYSHFSYINENLKIATPFAVREEVSEWIKHVAKKHKLTIIPSCISIISNIREYLEEKNLNAEEKIAIYINKQKVHVAILYRNELIYYNILDCEQEKIFISELLSILSELGIDRFTHQAIVFGVITKKNPIINIVEKYIKYVSLGHSKSIFSFGRNTYKKIFAENIDLF